MTETFPQACERVLREHLLDDLLDCSCGRHGFEHISRLLAAEAVRIARDTTAHMSIRKGVDAVIAALGGEERT